MLRFDGETLDVDYVEIPRSDDIPSVMEFISLYGIEETVRAIDPSILDNKDLFMRLVSIDGNNIRFASQRLKNSLSLVKKAYDNDPECLQYVPKSVARDLLLY